MTPKQLMIITQKAMKNMIGYFAGYISKRQKIGLFELRTSTAALPFVEEKIKAMKTASAQVAHVTNRLHTTLEDKG
eukprot:7131715-Karenia_brevis.AAC.1